MISNYGLKRILAVVLLMLCMTNLISIPANAAEVSGKLTVVQTVKKNASLPVAERYFNYRLTYVGSNDDSDSQENASTEFSIYMNDSEEVKFTFQHAGIHTYRLEHVPPAKKLSYMTYDRTVYIIRAYVSNDNDGLSVKFTIEDENGEKVDTIAYRHIYSVPTDSPKTGDQMNLGLYCSVMVLSAGAIVILFLLKRKKNRQNQDTSEELVESQEKTEE